jgi:hypothetical protein
MEPEKPFFTVDKIEIKNPDPKIPGFTVVI